MPSYSSQSVTQLYTLVDDLMRGFNGGKLLRELKRHEVPTCGVYFFFEDGENRQASLSEPRIVRVGTHALKADAKSTLYGRLSQHRGARNGSGNHRGSVFRLHVGKALLSREPAKFNCPSWATGQTAPAEVRAREHDLEKAVSDYIGAIRVIWLNIADSAGPESDRGLIERGAISTLSSATAASPKWLGRFTQNPAIIGSSLWNVNHVAETQYPNFLGRFEKYMETTLRAL
jgi:hypothetical protein